MGPCHSRCVAPGPSCLAAQAHQNYPRGGGRGREGNEEKNNAMQMVGASWCCMHFPPEADGGQLRCESVLPLTAETHTIHHCLGAKIIYVELQSVLIVTNSLCLPAVAQ